MTFEPLLKFVTELWHDAPWALALGCLGVILFIWIILDAQRGKKKRPRHRGKH